MFRRNDANRLAIVLSIPVLVLGLAAARAADRTDDGAAETGDYSVSTRKVPIADLNLASPEDQRRLRHRLSVAARRVCLEAGGSTAINDNSILTCYETAMHGAWAAAQEKIQVASAKSHLVASSQTRTPVRSQEVASSAGN